MIESFPLKRGPLVQTAGVMSGWRVTSTFGTRPNPLTGRPGNHGGMDLAYGGCEGQPILAPCGGRVTQGWDSSGGGNWTGVAGHDGCYWGLGHASRFESAVNGRDVPAGAVVAYVGTTGGSTGPHLHIAYRAPGAVKYSDPYELLAAASPKQGDWLSMATEDDVRRMVAQQVDASLLAMIPLLRDFRDYAVLVDSRKEAGGPIAYVLSGLQKAWLPTPAYHALLVEAASKGQAINDLGWQGAGSPWIALLDLAALVGPAPATNAAAAN